MKWNLWTGLIGATVIMCLAGFIVVQIARKKNMQKAEISALPYAYNALEPHIDARTIEIHYTKHHQGYVDKLNKALEKYPELRMRSLEDLLVNLEQVPEDIRREVRNQGGGHFVHTFFWNCMAPVQGVRSEPKGVLKDALEKRFGSIEGFKKKFEEVALGQFGSGWAWLVVDRTGELKIIGTVNHDIPQRDGYTPLLVVDVWEHAYYLKFQNRRAEFLAAWWNVVNWPYVEEKFTSVYPLLVKGSEGYAKKG